MRVLPSALVGTLALAGALILPAAQASAAAPSAPYNVFTTDGADGSYIVDNGEAEVIDNSNGLTVSTLNGGIAFSGPGIQPTVAYINPVTDHTPFVAGTTYSTLGEADATHPGLEVVNGSRACNQTTGTLDVEEVSYNAGGNITAFAATYSLSCDTGSPAYGELRYNSTNGYVAATSTPIQLDYGTLIVGRPAVTQTVTVKSLGSQTDTFGAATIADDTEHTFALVSDDCVGKTLSYGQTCTVSVSGTAKVVGHEEARVVIPDSSASGTRQAHLYMWGAVSHKGTYHALFRPTRILDTRDGTGVPEQPLGPDSSLHLQVAGKAGVPATDVSAVVMNVTVTGPTAASYVTVFPTGVTRPTASNINFPQGWTGANGVTVKLGTDGEVDIYNRAGSTQVIADVVGYYDGVDLPVGYIGGSYLPLAHAYRMLDTRAHSIGAIPAHGKITTYVDLGAVKNDVSALAVNVTAVNATKTGYLTVWNGRNTVPTASTLNFTAAATVSNLATVTSDSCTLITNFACPTEGPSITIYNGSSAPVDVIVDLFGIYDGASLEPGGLRFSPVTPARIADTRIGLGATGAIGAKATAPITALSTIADSATIALSTNLTAVYPTAATYLTVWPSGVAGATRPNVSNLNPKPGQVIANGATTVIGSTHAFNVYNNAGSTNVVIDVNGLFDYQPALNVGVPTVDPRVGVTVVASGWYTAS